MKVLLTGATGFIGSYVLKDLLDKEIEVITIGRTRPSISTTFIEADLLKIADFNLLMQQTQATHLLHLAWYAQHGKYWTSSLNLRWVDTTTRLVESFCVAGGQQVVLAGSCAEYDWNHGYCQENSTPLNPVTLYGVAKDAARRLTMAICAQYRVPCSWGRIFFPYGPGEDRQRLIPSLIDVFEGQRKPFAVNATAYRDFIHVEDVARGLIQLLFQKAQGTYNISSGQPTCIANLVRQIAANFNCDPQKILELTSERTHEPRFLVGDNQRLLTLGWSPTHHINDTQ